MVLADVKRDFENDDACAFRTFSNDRDSVGAAATCNVAATAFTCFALFLRFPEQLRSKVFFSIPQPWLPGPPRRSLESDVYEFDYSCRNVI